MEEIPNSIEFSDSDGDDIYLSQVVDKIERNSVNVEVARFDLGLEELMNSSTDSTESGCDVHFVDSDGEICGKKQNFDENEVSGSGQQCQEKHVHFGDAESDDE